MTIARGLILALILAGCGADEPEVRYTPDPTHRGEVGRDPYKLTCGDLRTQSRSSTSQRMVIEAEFELADEPALRERVRAMTENRVGRSLYWAMTEICTGRDSSFEPGRQAVAAVRRGRYLVQPRPESWNRPAPAGSGDP
jgi:hypothetical protein